MSKSTKIIAALGVVAGLGVAALPAFTYAAESVNGNADLYVEVLPAIAMTITGNNDDASDADHMHQTSGDPSETTENHGAVARTSVADAFGITTNANTSSSKIEDLTPNAYGSATSTVTVFTNNNNGYNLTLSAANPALTNESNDTINAGVLSGTTGGQGVWSFQTNTSEHEEGDSIVPALTWTAAATSAKTLRNTTAKTTTGGSETVVTYGVSTSDSQGTGIYKTTITYTAATND